MNIEQLQAHIKYELEQADDTPYFPDDDSMRSGYKAALLEILNIIQDDDRVEEPRDDS